MRRFKLNKLVRDGSLEWAKQGIVMKSNKLVDDELFFSAVIEKIYEELDEVLNSETYAQLTEEMGDLEEMIAELKKLAGLEQKNIDAVHAKKIEKNGTHSQRIFCEYIDVPETEASLISYYVNNSNRFPELDPATNEIINTNLNNEGN